MLDEALSGLPPEFRAPVVLRDVLGLDYAEIAEVLDIPPGTVRSRIARGRRSLANRDGPEPAPAPKRPTPGTMNPDDLLPEPDPVDLLASARLDGEAADLPPGDDPAEVDARQEVLASVRARLAEPVTLPEPSVIDDQIAQALAALDDADAAEAGPAGVDPVVPLAARRAPRPRGRRWLAAAAAVVVIAALAGAIVASNRPHSSSFDTVAAPVNQSSSTTVANSTSQRATSGAVASTTTAPGVTPDAASVPDLGAVASDASLGAEVLAESSAMASTDPTTTAASTEQATTTLATMAPFHTAPVAAPSCDAAVRQTIPSLGKLVFSATASYQGEPVQVMVYEGATPGTYELVAARVGGLQRGSSTGPSDRPGTAGPRHSAQALPCGP